MKRIIILLLFLFSSFVYSIEKNEFKSLDEIKALKFSVKERQFINKKEKKLEYLVTIEFPDRIRKEIVFPELNKGELYVYNADKKSVYLPLFGEYRELSVEAEENNIIKTINKLRNLEKNSNSQKEYQEKKLKSLVIDEENNTRVEIKEYLIKDGYILPKNLDIIDGDIVLGNVEIEKVEIEPKIEKNTFILRK